MKQRSFLPALVLLGVFAASFIAPAPARAADLKILKFEADWCGACQKMKPVFASVAAEESGVSFQTVNVDRQSELADRYRVTSLPTVVAVKDGREVGRLTGYQNAAKLRSFVKKHR
jgi:thioredoxin 1